MGNFIFTPLKKVKSHLLANKRLYLVSALIVLMGIVLGIYLVNGEYIDDVIYTTTDLDLSEVVLGEVGGFKLFFLNLKALIIPFIIIFILHTNKYTSFLSYFYLGYQGLLLGASISAVIGETGIAGGLNTLLIILPINLMNLYVIIAFLVVCYKRLTIARLQRLSFLYSTKLVSSQILGCLLGAIFASCVYGFVYPLLLKTAVVVIV